MKNFSYYNPVRVEFGKGAIANMKDLIPRDKKILMVYGGGSIKSNGVYDQAVAALAGCDWLEYSGIEPNPSYHTCLKCIELIKKEKVEFLLAVGGGSVLDAVKFIAAGALSESSDLWQSVVKEGNIEAALPLGAVLTLPATGSEMNCYAVISNYETKEKLSIGNEKLYPLFSVLDPETTYSLPSRQVANGIVDTFVHVLEQYLTTDLTTPVQDRWAEGILLTLIENGKKIMDNPQDYDLKAMMMWCATTALNGMISPGVDEDWATHNIGHEITALYGVDHARSLALVLPGLMSVQRKSKQKKLLQYADRVWGISMGDINVRIDEAIGRTMMFFQSLGVPVRFVDSNIDPTEASHAIAEIFNERDEFLGEHQDISGEVVRKILLERQCLYEERNQK